jgi:predicted permease
LRVPARQAARADVNAALKGVLMSSPVAGRRRALRDLLVAVQVGLCVLLLSACVLSLRGLQHMLGMPLGFEPQGLTIAGFQLGPAGYDRQRGEALQQRALAAVSTLPGVQAAAYANSLPLSLDQSTTTVFRADEPGPPASAGHGVNYYQTSPGLFRTLGTRLLAGREFEPPRDGLDAPRVAIVNEAFVKRVFGAANPLDAIGAHVRHGGGPDLIEVVGVVEDGKYVSLTESPRAVVFWPMRQVYNEATTVVVRSAIGEEQMAAQVRDAIRALDPALPLYGVGSAEQMLGFVLLPSRAAAIALSAFGLLALLLAATGIHGLLAYAVARRSREIGIRMAVGASLVDLLRLVLGRIAAMIAIGAVLGLLLVFRGRPAPDTHRPSRLAGRSGRHRCCCPRPHPARRGVVRRARAPGAPRGSGGRIVDRMKRVAGGGPIDHAAFLTDPGLIQSPETRIGRLAQHSLSAPRSRERDITAE